MQPRAAAAAEPEAGGVVEAANRAPHAMTVETAEAIVISIFVEQDAGPPFLPRSTWSLVYRQKATPESTGASPQASGAWTRLDGDWYILRVSAKGATVPR